MSEKVIEKINWPLWILVIIIVNILANLAQGILGAQGGYYGCLFSMGIVCMPFTIPTLAVVLPMLLYLGKLTGKARFSSTTLATLYIIGLVSSYTIGNFNDAYYSWPVGSVSRVWRSIPAVRDAMKTLWWVPPEAAIAPTWGAGGPVDWAAWFPAMLYVCLFHWILFAICSPQMIILRRRWIEVERVPYPWTMAIWEGVKNVHGFEEVKHRRTPFLMGLAVGLFLYVVILLRYLFPWFPDILGWYALYTSPNGCVDGWCPAALRPIGSTLVGFVRINIQPINFAIAYLVPLDILFTAWFMHIILIILAQVAYYMGYYSGALELSGVCRIWGFFGGGAGVGKSPFWHAPIYWSYLCLTGGMVAFILMMMWYSRDYLKDVVKVAFGKPSSITKEVEAKEPVSYKTAFILLLVGCILWIAFLGSLQIDLILGAIVFILGGFLYPLAEAYAQGLIGAAYAQQRTMWVDWPAHFIWSRHPGTYTAGWCNALIILNRGVNTGSGGIPTWSTVTMSGFKLADLSGVHSRTVYKLIALTLLIAYPITVVFRVWWPHYLGARFPNCLSGWECAAPGEGVYNCAPPSNELIGPVVVGFVITVLLYSLRARFIWWPLHPLGFLISGGARITWPGAWTNFLGAWVAKWLTLKIGGSKAYEGYGIPFVAGLVVGFVMVAIIGVISGLIRWFVPF
jgi:hypothetical protein